MFKKSKQYLILSLIFVLGLSVFASAADKSEIDISRISVGAAVLGQGGWSSAIANGPDSALNNPAGLAQVSVIKATSMYTSLLKEYDYTMASGIYPMGKFGTIALSYIGASTDADYRRDANGNPLGKMSYADTIMQLSYGVPLRNLWRPHMGEEKMNVGASLKMYNKGWSGAGISAASATGMGLDLGMQYKINKWSDMGLTWKNALINSISWTSGTSGTLPSVLKLGYAANVIGIDAPYTYGLQKVTVGGDIDLPMGSDGVMLYHAGAEYWPLNNLAVRMGLDQTQNGKSADTNLTLGLGLKYDTISFDYAYHPYAGIAENDTHYFSISYINKEKEKHYVQISTPQDKFVTMRDKIVLSGVVIDSDVAKIMINEEVIELDKDKNFSKEIELKIGKNVSEIIAIDEYGYVLEAIDLRQLRLTSFADVSEDFWASLPISQLATLELVNGYPDGNFKPQGDITRAEVTTLLAKAREANPIGKPVTLFNDMTVGHWANNYVNGSYALGLVTGYPDGSFAPKNNITRAEGVALITRFDGIVVPAKVENSPYEDVSADHWVAPLLTVAKAAGLLSYLNSNMFEDKKMLNRAETVEILSKTEYVRKKLDDLYNWDSYVYQTQEKIVVERQEITPDFDKLKVIDDSAKVQNMIVAVKAENKAKAEEARVLKFSPVETNAMAAQQKATMEPVYNAYLPYDKKEAKKLEVAALEVDTKKPVVAARAATVVVAEKAQPPVVVVKQEVAKVEVASVPVEEAAVEEAPQENKVVSALKGAILGRWLGGKDKKDVAKTDIHLQTANAQEVSQYRNQADVKLGPDVVTTKLYIKVSIPAEAKA
ncbi:MAG: S-layer homology domain-containing protein, partial [Candidatus Margulisiibacteriota bacterium]